MLSKEKKHRLVAQGALLAVAATLVAAYLVFMPKPPTPVTLPTTTLIIGNTTLVVELATTEEERHQGLSGRASLGEGQGMFFVFDTPGNWGFWMKDMRFAIDIIWADQNGTIVAIDRDVEPASFPKTFSPGTLASYVLEVPAGYTKAKGITIGQQIVVK